MSIITLEASGHDLTVLDVGFIAEMREIGLHPFILYAEAVVKDQLESTSLVKLRKMPSIRR